MMPIRTGIAAAGSRLDTAIRPAPNGHCPCGWYETACGGPRDFFFLDKDAHIWYGSPPNNRAGYFYVSTRQRSADAR
jgi:hypothetical protein